MMDARKKKVMLKLPSKKNCAKKQEGSQGQIWITFKSVPKAVLDKYIPSKTTDVQIGHELEDLLQMSPQQTMCEQPTITQQQQTIIQQQQTIPITPKYSCSHCSLEFESPLLRSNHEQLHSVTSSPYKCTLCHVTTTGEEQYRHHVAQYHINDVIDIPNQPVTSCASDVVSNADGVKVMKHRRYGPIGSNYLFVTRQQVTCLVATVYESLIGYKQVHMSTSTLTYELVERAARMCALHHLVQPHMTSDVDLKEVWRITREVDEWFLTVAAPKIVYTSSTDYQEGDRLFLANEELDEENCANETFIIYSEELRDLLNESNLPQAPYPSSDEQKYVYGLLVNKPQLNTFQW